MGVVLLTSGEEHDNHSHPIVEEILYVISGKGGQTVNNEVPRPIKAGMRIHVPADVTHSTINTAGNY